MIPATQLVRALLALLVAPIPRLVGLCLLLACSLAHAGVDEGIAAFEAGNYTRALAQLKPEAESGNPEAQYIVGSMYARGVGVQKDTEQGLSWYARAAQSGHALAQRNLALTLWEGEGSYQDRKKAIYWFRKAARQQDAVAQRYLGLALSNGSVVPRNHALSVKWLTKAARLGDVQAQFLVGWHYERGLGVKVNQVKARDFYLKAAHAGNADAQFALASLLDRTEIGSPSTEAYRWYRRAADQGNAGAQLYVGIYKANGWGGQARDLAEAYAWTLVASDEPSGGAASRELLRLLRADMTVHAIQRAEWRADKIRDALAGGDQVPDWKDPGWAQE